ncbi:MAG: hypothetical protein HY558_01790 [Euryarchaeota archaeon]|nr:hypothetical protein [Euryarchaeota archaeon]
MMARIRVDPARPTGAVDPRIYGQFIEHIDHCIYGGILDSHFRPRREVLDRIRALRPPVVRWPGGLFADGYHWEDGIGPPDRRPVRGNYWSRLGRRLGPQESNRFGTDEFLDFCREVETRPYINVNVGSGTPGEAARWVDYTRRHSPHVPLWGIGNELHAWWAIGHTTPQTYARRYLEFSRAMREVDPGIELVAVGADPRGWPRWNPGVLQAAGREKMEHLSVHFYLPTDYDPLWSLLGHPRRDPGAFRALVAAPLLVEERLRACIQTLDSCGSPARLAVDEWNVLWSVRDHWRWDWTLQEAIFAAGFFHVLHRLGSRVSMANYAQLVNLLGLLRATDQGVVPSPVYSIFLLYRDGEGEALATGVECARYPAPRLEGLRPRGEVPLLDASAIRNRDTLHLFVINRHPTRGQEAEIDLGSWESSHAEAREVAGEPWARNTPEEPERVRVEEKEPPEGAKFSRTFPPASVTRLDFVR